MRFLNTLINFASEYHHKRIFNHLEKIKIYTMIDVGAHKGEFISFANSLKSVKKIYAFEPQQKIFNILNQKFKKKKKIKFYNLALDKRKRCKIIYINNLSSTSTLSSFNKNSYYLKLKNILTRMKKNYSQRIKINTDTLDNILIKNKLKNCLLKIDVEGFELNVLKGSIKKLKEIDFVLIENQFGKHYENADFKKVDNFLKKNNFKSIKKFIFPFLHYQDILYKKIL